MGYTYGFSCSGDLNATEYGDIDEVLAGDAQDVNVDSMQSQLHELRTNAETQRRRADEEHERASDLAVRVKILEVCSTPTCWWMCHELVVVVVVVSCVVVSCE